LAQCKINGRKGTLIETLPDPLAQKAHLRNEAACSNADACTRGHCTLARRCTQHGVVTSNRQCMQADSAFARDKPSASLQIQCSSKAQLVAPWVQFAQVFTTGCLATSFVHASCKSARQHLACMHKAHPRARPGSRFADRQYEWQRQTNQQWQQRKRLWPPRTRGQFHPSELPGPWLSWP
jgi:hypothetical protein